MPPNSSGMVRPNTPSSAIWRDDLERDVAVGAVPALRVGRPPRCRRTCASRRGSIPAYRRDRRRRPSRRGCRASVRRAARGAAPYCPRRSAPRPRGVMRAATAAADSPRSDGRTISPWLIGMPPRICARYSPSPMRTSSSSISPSRAGSLASARRRRRAGAPPRRRSRARPSRASRAARGRTAAAHDAAVDRDALAHLGGGVGQQRLRRCGRAARHGHQVMARRRADGAACGMSRSG